MDEPRHNPEDLKSAEERPAGAEPAAEVPLAEPAPPSREGAAPVTGAIVSPEGTSEVAYITSPRESAPPAPPEPLAASLAAASAPQVPAAYEHPWAVRFCHWLNAISLAILIGSGLQIFTAFPSFGPKVPEKDLLQVPEGLTLGGWLAGGRHWHFTFAWVFVATGLLYLGYQFVSGHYRTVLFRPRDIRGVWPMVRHYFFFGPKPPVREQYNPLQKLAYTCTVLFGVASVLTGLVLYHPVQFSWLAWLMGGFHWARVWHFAAMCGFLAFIPGHLLMVALHGWNNFASMLTGWKKNPEYLSD